MKLLPYFRWYPADAETDANFRAMDDADIGFYIRCLNHAWINGGIPADPKERARVLRTRLDTANKRWERVGKCFEASRTILGILVNPRAERERIHAISKSLKAAESVNVRYERTTNELPRALARAESVVRSSLVVINKIPSGEVKTKPSGFNSAEAADFSANGFLGAQISQEWPLTEAAIVGFFPSADRVIVQQVLDACARAWLSEGNPKIPEPDDSTYAAAVKAAHTKKQTSAALFIKTAAQVIQNWAKHGRPGANGKVAQVIDYSKVKRYDPFGMHADDRVEKPV